jgi:hypothetical protein
MAAPHLSHACALIPREASRYALRGRPDARKCVSVGIFGISAHAGHGEDLLILLHALLELAKQDSETCGR